MIYSFDSLAEKNNNPKQNKKGCENLLMIVSSFLSQHEPRTNANWYIGFIIFIFPFLSFEALFFDFLNMNDLFRSLKITTHYNILQQMLP